MKNSYLTRARKYFLNGGGGFEDGEDGARASTFTFEGMCEMAAAFAEYEVDRVNLAREIRLMNLFSGLGPRKNKIVPKRRQTRQEEK